MDARTSKRQKKISKRQEQSIAEDLGGRTQPASGAMSGAKGDVRKMGVVRAEAKYTAKDSFTLKLAELDKIIGEAGLEAAVLQIGFVDRVGRPILELAVFPWKAEGATLSAARATIQSFRKSMLIPRDKIGLKVLKEEVFVVFSGKPGTEHRWFRIMPWKNYVTMMEVLNA